MTDAQQREAARQFFYKWNGKGKEDEDARSYWLKEKACRREQNGRRDRVSPQKMQFTIR